MATSCSIVYLARWCLTGCPNVNAKLPAEVDFAILNTRINLAIAQ